MCTILTPPPGTHKLLGHGPKYCIERSTPSTESSDTIYRLRHTIRLRQYLIATGRIIPGTNRPDEDDDFNPRLYVNSKWKPPPCDATLELRMMDFAERYERATLAYSRRSKQTNLSNYQYSVLQDIKSDRRFIVCLTDKNLGPAIIEREVYLRRCLDDHLDQPDTYRQLSPTEAGRLLAKTQLALRSLLAVFQRSLGKDTKTYFERSLDLKHRTPQFYITLKVHKTPWAMRPVVSCVGSYNEIFSKWLDDELKKLLPLSKTYLRDSAQVLDELEEFGPLPPRARLFTADARSMYTNIDTAHALEVFHTWFERCPDEIPGGFPKTLFLRVLELVMTRNIFQFDDTYWLQTNGTAMGTSVACMYATMYYALHERFSILPTFGQALLYYKRFIDDVVGIWIGTPAEWRAFQKQLDTFGSLRWDVSLPTRHAVFLDLNIRIDATTHKVWFSTYQKPLNLFLYIPPRSAHPPGVLKSTIYGNLQRFHRQNTNRIDFIRVAREFAEHLVTRGHSHDVVADLFREVAASLDAADYKAKRSEKVKATGRNTLFVHAEYHPRGVPRQSIRRMYTDTLQGHDDFERLVVAYRRPRNLRDALMRTKLNEPEGARVSDLLTSRRPTGGLDV